MGVEHILFINMQMQINKYKTHNNLLSFSTEFEVQCTLEEWEHMRNTPVEILS